VVNKMVKEINKYKKIILNDKIKKKIIKFLILKNIK